MRLINRFINFFSKLYWKYIASPIKYGRHIGVKIGNDCLISTRYWSSEPYLIEIGNHVQVTDKVSFHTHGGGNCIRAICPEFDVFGKIKVEDWAYIGAYSHIMAGVTIGEGALVAAGSVVTRSVAPHTVVGGNPAKFICTTEDYLNRNIMYSVGRRLTKTEKREVLMNLPEHMFLKK
jgi:Acetyltransferase (isoleucine patch superfamily)